MTLVTLHSPIKNGAWGAEVLPSRLKVLGWGESRSVKGPVRLTDASAAKLEVNQRALGFEKVALDFEHNTVPGSAEYERTREPRAVAGYGVPRVVPGDGLYLEEMEWRVGREEALNYADLSPAVSFDEAGNVCFVHSVALTRNGAIEGLSFYSVEQNKGMETLKPENVITVAEMGTALGLATATKAEVLGELEMFAALARALHGKDRKVVVLDAVNDLETRLKVVEAGVKGLGTLSATVDGKVVTLSAEEMARIGARLDRLEGGLKDAASAEEKRERARVVACFAAEGKVPRGADGKELSQAELVALDLATLRMLHANTPSTVPLSARGARAVEGQSGLKGLDRTRAAFQAQYEAANRG